MNRQLLLQLLRKRYADITTLSNNFRKFGEVENGADPRFASDAASTDDNTVLNRYTNILPYDSTRVKLQNLDGGQSDYINANYLKADECPQVYIATQGPLPETFSHFWQMVWEQNASVVLMLTNFIEKGQHKCHEYFPLTNKKFDTEQFELTLLGETKLLNFTERTLQLYSKKAKFARQLHHIHYTSWPDHGVPTSAGPVLELIERLRIIQPYYDAPIVVHCSAGCGRSGTFCTIDSALYLLANDHYCNNIANRNHLESQHLNISSDNIQLSIMNAIAKTNNSLNNPNNIPNNNNNSNGNNRSDNENAEQVPDVIFEIIYRFRHQRTWMVQTMPQYLFCYQAVLEKYGV